MSDPGVVDDPVDGGRGEGGEDGDGGEDPFEEITVFLVLGAGFVALFAGLEFFWMIWVLGFAVLLPLVSVLSRHYGPILSGRERPDRANGGRIDGRDSALETLKERYARGEIDEDEFESRLERLVENEDVADVERRLGDDQGREREFEFET